MAAVGAGAVLVPVGAALVYLYLAHAVVGTMGRPDRSALYWYIPVLLAGVGAGGAGGALLFAGIVLASRGRHRSRGNDPPP